MKKFLFLFLVFININTASLTQLDELTGIGPKYAQAIIDARPFSSVDDLVKVKGIGPKTLQKIKDQGLACVNCATTPDPSLRGATQNEAKGSNEAIPAKEIASSATPPRNDVPATITYPAGVFINEILPNPEGADETEELFELYNSNNFDVDLSNWQIADTAGTITAFTISKDTKILANNFLVFKRQETKIMLNNDEDGLNLLSPDKKIIDSVTFSKAPLGQSYNKTNSGWAWSTTLTPGTKNIITTPQVKTSTKALPKAVKSDNNKIELAVANLSQTANQTASPWFLFFTVLAITIILASAVLFIKLKLQKTNVGT